MKTNSDLEKIVKRLKKKAIERFAENNPLSFEIRDAKLKGYEQAIKDLEVELDL